MPLIILLEIIIQPDFLPAIQFLRQVAVFDINDFFLKKAVFTIEVLHHLIVYLTRNLPPVHHNDILHSVYTIAGFIVVAYLCDELKQQFRAALRLFVKLC